MRIDVMDDLTKTQSADWRRFLDSTSRAHPEQDPQFAAGYRARGHKVLFAMGWVEDQLSAVGLFVAEPHPLLPGYWPVARAFSGPVADTPRAMADFLAALEQHPDFSAVGRLEVTPYWLSPGALGLAATLDQIGWSAYETPFGRATGIYDLSGTPDALIAQFKKSARRELRRALEFGFDIEYVTDEAVAMEALPILQKHVANRDGEPVDPEAYREELRRIYAPGEIGSFFVLRSEGEIVAGAMNLRSTDTLFFRRFFIDDDVLPRLGKIRLAPVISFEGMRWGQEKGCRWADENGYIHGLDPTHPLFQINKYKEAFNPTEVQRVPGHCKVLRPRTERVAQMLDRGLGPARRLGRAVPARRRWPRVAAARPAGGQAPAPSRAVLPLAAVLGSAGWAMALLFG